MRTRSITADIVLFLPVAATSLLAVSKKPLHHVTSKYPPFFVPHAHNSVNALAASSVGDDDERLCDPRDYSNTLTPSNTGTYADRDALIDGNVFVSDANYSSNVKYKPSIILPPSSTGTSPSRGIIVIDPFFHCERIIDNAIEQYEIGVVRVLSPYIAQGLNKDNDKNSNEGRLRNEEQIDEDVVDHRTLTAPLSDSELQSWLDEVPFPITAVICESDSGLDYAERLACAIDRLNGDEEPISFYHNGYNAARRDKYQMNEVCQAAGIDVAKQAACGSVEEAVEKAKEFGIEGGTKLIIKPRRGVASDRVSLCTNVQSVRNAASDILSSTVFGTHENIHKTVLLQEFVDGTEYAVDVVSREGEHKVSSIWVYDRVSTADDGESNPFAYLSSKLVSADDERYPASGIIQYVQSCLDALHVRYGMSHSEVKVTPEGDIRLMEVNARQQNDMIWPLSDICVGYNALDLCLSAYLDQQSDDDMFDLVPSRPVLQRSGMVVSLVCYAEGKVKHINHMEEIESLESYVAMEIYPSHEVGNVVGRSKDIRTDGGWIHLIHENEDQMMKDYQQICKLMYTMFHVEGTSTKAQGVTEIDNEESTPFQPCEFSHMG